MGAMRKVVGSIVSMDERVPLDDLAQGLDWVRWMLRSVRHRCEGVVLERPDASAEIRLLWRGFVQNRFEANLGRVLIDAWQASADGDMRRLIELEAEWAWHLNDDELERSIAAGRLLLSSTRGARYQGALGHLREAVDEGRAKGIIGVVWPAVAHLFQLTPAALLAEYLRLEWETATRDLYGVNEPRLTYSIPSVVSRVLNVGAADEPRVLRRRAMP
ncbi:MAG: hypothetical protein JWO89_3320 [Verrucomicrobiaceae bacterium]|nr:hypothetical protein [Verrucomicrobiaceae bacterium]